MTVSLYLTWNVRLHHSKISSSCLFHKGSATPLFSPQPSHQCIIGTVGYGCFKCFVRTLLCLLNKFNMQPFIGFANQPIQLRAVSETGSCAQKLIGLEEYR
ncbi:hypothetical protein XELAEV_18021497mg [Xenopus laevis]|uniref:Uncharacterized protein n=1 Tax=Xenopus laevis TaxID=8355 RepID=A0A974HRW5_XENLA|nr:hypothetical protein XELAEV_18021497mg [Xenopus laevis]